MARETLHRCFWLAGIIYNLGPIRKSKINDYWSRCRLNESNESVYDQKMFYKDKAKIEEIFEVEIKKNENDEYYVIRENILKDNFQRYIFERMAYSTYLLDNKLLRNHIAYEKTFGDDIFIEIIIEAIRKGRRIIFEYQKFGEEKSSIIKMEPHYLKQFNHRWYITGRVEKIIEPCSYDLVGNKDIVYRTYGTDRILDMDISDDLFLMSNNVNVDKFFKNCAGIYKDDTKLSHLVIKVKKLFVDYWRTAPIHHSQKETETSDDYSIFEMDVDDVPDLYQVLLSEGNMIEVLSPDNVRKEMQRRIEDMHIAYQK